MAKTAQDVMQLIREQGIKMVDFKMVDINGQYRHVTIPAQNFTEATMTDGIGFDASNYGYAVVEKSDMVFIPDPATAQIDPFCEVSTLSMTGNAMIIDYPHNRPLDQYPRNIVLAAEQYMRDIYRKYGNEFNSYSTTGHSLGGNLAEHAVITAPDGMRGKIDGSVNLDGPGFSNQYLTAHANDIKKSKGLLTHYQWSWCGRLFNAVPGSYYQTVEAQTPDKGNLLLSMGWRHDTYNVVRFDENGNAIPGNPDWFAIAAAPWVNAIDFTFFQISGGALGVLYNTIDSIKDGLEGLWKSWEEIRISYCEQAEFELDIHAAECEIEQLSEVIPQMNEIRDAVEQIQRKLAFQSIAAGYVKVKLWSAANHIGQDAKRMDSFCRAGRECTQCYQSYEQEIVDNYV